MITFISTLIMLCAGYLVLAMLLGRASDNGAESDVVRGRNPSALFWIFLIPLVGVSTVSVFYFFWIMFIDAGSLFYLLFEAGLLGWGFYLVKPWQSLDLRFRFSLKEVNSINAYATLLVVFLILISSYFVMNRALDYPFGYWDAWDRINVKTHLLAVDQQYARTSVTSDATQHPDYPLLLQSFAGRTWHLAGGSNLLVLQVISGLTSTWLLALMALVIHHSMKGFAALGGVLLCVSTSYFWFWSGMQYVDLLLAILIILTLYFQSLYLMGEKRMFGVYLFFVAATAWSKNEGTAFAAISVLLTLGVMKLYACHYRELVGKRNWPGLIFSALTLLAVLVVKQLSDEGSNLFDSVNHKVPISDKILDFERYAMIAKYFGECFTEFDIWCVLAGVTAIAINIRGYSLAAIPGLLTLLGLSAVYFLIFVITPNDLSFHLSTAMDRLILQLWPCVIVGLSLCFRQRLQEREEAEIKKEPSEG